MTREELAGKSREELLAIAKKLKISVHPRCKDETIIYKILQQPEAFKAKAMQDDEKPKVVFNNTPDQVREAIAEQLKKEGFKAEFPGDGTVIFTYRGISESVNLSIPLHVIVRQAKSAAKAKFAPPFAKAGDGIGGDKILVA